MSIVECYIRVVNHRAASDHQITKWILNRSGSRDRET